MIDFVIVYQQFSIFTCQNKRKRAMLGSNLPGIVLTVDENIKIKELVSRQPFDVFRDLSFLKKSNNDFDFSCSIVFVLIKSPL